ncbi:LOW QUALITY PROTEIN: C-type lectin-like domain family 1 [Rhinopithecus roxellana]|uniref:LOW QUALITY PROTEIN: C-type lectin-like domain family 1 n=1 Tax=Rhinopithecus roxellana TaxID=61622 RepID=UPI00123754EC|nr:LOW QUALITY PROTEIN: C-type lectin-like domain family 1 [Rhinopithecus roxellana]
MVSNFFHVIQVFKKSVTLISKTEHIGFVIYSWRKSTTHLGSRRKSVISIYLTYEVSLQKYDCSLSGTSFVGFCLFSVYILAGDVVYADIKTVRTSPLELPSPVQRSVSFNFATVLKSCPAKDWKVHKGKCHWIVETKKSWNESQNDYATKNSYLMVIQHITAMMITFLLYLQMASFQCLYLSDVSLCTFLLVRTLSDWIRAHPNGLTKSNLC